MKVFDIDFVRSHFPALHQSPWALFDNAGGTVLPKSVIDRTQNYMSRFQINVGAEYELSQQATEHVEAGHQAAAELLGVPRNEVVLNPSTTMNVFILAQALRKSFAPEDEIIISDLDHEANRGAWRRLSEFGVVIRNWAIHPESKALELSSLQSLLNKKTKLVCFTHCSNLVGQVHNVEAITKTVHDAGARVCVDGVAYAPHRLLELEKWQVDFYLVSLYKVFAPHIGVLFGKHQHLKSACGQNHPFLDENDIPYKFQPGNVNHELTASLPGTMDYLRQVDRHHFPNEDPELYRQRVFDLFAGHESKLASKLLDYLHTKSTIRIIGTSSVDPQRRLAIVSFAPNNICPRALLRHLASHHIAARCGHFYCPEAMAGLGIQDSEGLVRISMAHYNHPQEVDRLIRSLDQIL